MVSDYTGGMIDYIEKIFILAWKILSVRNILRNFPCVKRRLFPEICKLYLNIFNFSGQRIKVMLIVILYCHSKKYMDFSVKTK